MIPLTRATPEVTPEVTLLSVLSGAMSREQLRESVGLKDNEHFRSAYLVPALKAGLIEMTIPDKPRSSKQRYRMTATGHEYLKKRRSPGESAKGSANP